MITLGNGAICVVRLALPAPLRIPSAFMESDGQWQTGQFAQQVIVLSSTSRVETLRLCCVRGTPQGELVQELHVSIPLLVLILLALRGVEQLMEKLYILHFFIWTTCTTKCSNECSIRHGIHGRRAKVAMGGQGWRKVPQSLRIGILFQGFLEHAHTQQALHGRDIALCLLLAPSLYLYADCCRCSMQCLQVFRHLHSLQTISTLHKPIHNPSIALSLQILECLVASGTQRVGQYAPDKCCILLHAHLCQHVLLCLCSLSV
mmetsp:Transcript_48162/g.112653  ORF Transcript_48162/g.112653 Transcript_48162/m.112653 type:complete len:261 (+) Transcript_48162:85-867(+)